MISYSVLDLCPISEGSTATQALKNSVSLAQTAEELGYRRFWLAEHHNIPGIASAATAVVMAHVAAATGSIRIGSGGVMLPNHAPLVIAEQFGTLEALHPGRIDLGLGRAPGSDMATARALRRTLTGGEDRFPQDVMELQGYLGWTETQGAVRATPGQGSRVPLWLLGSSTFGAQLAAHLGLPYAFASHFAPGMVDDAVHVYRTMFRPSEQLDRPHVMVGMNIFAAPTDEEARYLSTSTMQSFLNLRRGRPTQLMPPQADFEAGLTSGEKAMLDEIFSFSAIGSPSTVAAQVSDLVARTDADEIIIAANIHDPDLRLRSYRIAADVLSEAKAA